MGGEWEEREARGEVRGGGLLQKTLPLDILDFFFFYTNEPECYWDGFPTSISWCNRLLDMWKGFLGRKKLSAKTMQIYFTGYLKKP